MAIVLGLNATTLRNSEVAGSIADAIASSANWKIVTNIRDETLNMDTSLADITTRKAAGWRLQVGTLSEGSVDCNILYDTADLDFQAFQTAFFAKSMILMAFYDVNPKTLGLGETSSGLKGGWSVTNFTINRQLEEAMMVDVTFTVRDDDLGFGPSWDTITGT